MEALEDDWAHINDGIGEDEYHTFDDLREECCEEEADDFAFSLFDSAPCAPAAPSPTSSKSSSKLSHKQRKSKKKKELAATPSPCPKPSPSPVSSSCFAEAEKVSMTIKSKVGQRGLCVIRLSPLTYVHKLNINTNVTSVVAGPQSFTLLDHEMITVGPEEMVTVPPLYYAKIKNPANIKIIDGHVEAEVDKADQVVIRHGDVEVRSDLPPFPLFPGEILVEKPQPIKIVEVNTALCLRAHEEGRYITKPSITEDAFEQDFKAGDEWMFLGPGTYLPHGHVQITETRHAEVLKNNEALHIEAIFDSDGKKTGDRWCIQKEGLYMPKINERIIQRHKAILISDTLAVSVKAIKTFTDQFGFKREIGDSYVITKDLTNAFIPCVEETVVETRELIHLSSNEFCYIEDNKGAVRIEKGEKEFFLPALDKLKRPPTKGIVLQSNAALHVRANRDFLEPTKVDEETGEVLASQKRVAGSRWTIYGPTIYFVPVEVNIIAKYKSMIEIGNLNALFFSKAPFQNDFAA